ncbi:hypothetical protein [Marinobacter sp.]|uniref:hypothetical protein n=1 Tax=Marinobacter sp. TaxID=50741 RepID=UPI0034A2F54B
MKRFLISSCIVGLLLATPPAMADSLRGQGYSPGVQIQVERGKMVPPGHQKKFLSARHRDHGYSRDHRRDRHWNKRHHKQHGYKDRHGFHDRRDYRGGHRQKYRSGYHRTYKGYDGRISHEERFTRIIRDTQVLIDASRR